MQDCPIGRRRLSFVVSHAFPQAEAHAAYLLASLIDDDVTCRPLATLGPAIKQNVRCGARLKPGTWRDVGGATQCTDNVIR
jgi:hypothetical protein